MILFRPPNTQVSQVFCCYNWQNHIRLLMLLSLAHTTSSVLLLKPLITLCWSASSAAEKLSTANQQPPQNLACFSLSSSPPYIPPSSWPSYLLLHASNRHSPPRLSTDLRHNSEPPFSLHTHSVQPSCKSLNPTPHPHTNKVSHAEVK